MPPNMPAPSEMFSGPLAMAGQLGGADGATRVALLTGSMSPQQKRAVRDEVASGDAGIVIGTHALLQEAVEFNRLGMVVVDEQHRFGVEQRDRLRAKAPDGLTPHLLVMTATPIPRTVALTVYGDLETSTLRELPRGRQPITTNTIFVKEKPAWLQRAWQRIIEEVGAGRQAYVVASRIDADDKAREGRHAEGPPATTVVTLFEHLRHGPLSGLRLGLMHGRLSADEKDAVMAAFRAGRDRCAGLHHRHRGRRRRAERDGDGRDGRRPVRHQPTAPAAGRIGRGQHPSLCLLATKLPEGSKAGERLKAVAAPWTASSSPTSISRNAAREMCWGSANPADPSRCDSCRLPSTSTSSWPPVNVLRSRSKKDARQSRNGRPGSATFIDTDRVEYLDKA